MKSSVFLLCKRLATVAVAVGFLYTLPASAEKLRVGYWTSGLTLGYGAVLEAGNYFKDQGLDVEYVHFSDVNGPSRGIAANAVDLAFAAPAAGAFSLATDGVPIKIILATQPSSVEFVVLDDSPIKSLADLKGKKIGMSPAGSSTATIAGAILAINYGIQPGQFSLVPGNESRLVQFVTQKDADAAALRNVTLAQFKDLKVRKLGSFGDEWKKLTKSDAVPYNAVAMIRKDWLDKNPQGAARAVVAMRKAMEFGHDHPGEVVKAVQQAANLPAADAQVFADLWDENYRVSLTAADKATLNRMYEIFKQNGTLKGNLPADVLDSAPYEASLKIK